MGPACGGGSVLFLVLTWSVFRFVVELVTMLPDFIEQLEEMVASLRCSPPTEAHLAQLVSSSATNPTTVKLYPN